MRQETRGSTQGSPRAMDPEVFAAHYRRAYPQLHLVAAGIIGDRTYAHDIVQEAAVIALQKSDKFNSDASYVAWLSEIVRLCSLNYARKVRGRRTTMADPELLAQTKSDGACHLDPWPICDETGELVDSQKDFDDEMLRALLDLKVEPRCCFLLRVVQNLSYAEISELMGIPEGTAMSHVHRSRRQLRTRLEQRAANAKPAGGNP